MKQLKISFVFLTLTCVCIQAIESNEQQVNDESYIFAPRIKRQSVQAAVRGQMSPKQQISTNQGGQVGSMAATMAASSGSGGISKPNDNDLLDKNNEEMSTIMNSGENLVPQAKPKKPLKKKPANNYQEDNEEDCYYGDDSDYREFDDYTGGIFRIATQPMRHFGRIMNNVFNQMPNYDNQQSNLNEMFPGGSSAVASASSSSNGNSRMLSSVSNNGRTRGIISETRNGRTQTRRIERNNDEDNEGRSSAFYDDE